MANIIKNSNKANKKKQPKRRRLLLVGVVLLTVVLITAAVWYFLSNKQPSDRDRADGGAFVQTEEEKQLDEIRNSIMVDGDVDKAGAALEEAIEQAESDVQKADFYSQRAVALISKDDVTEADRRQALDDALAAYELDSSPGNARLIQTIAKELGEDALADEYGQIVAESIANTPSTEMKVKDQKGGQ